MNSSAHTHEQARRSTPDATQSLQYSYAHTRTHDTLVTDDEMRVSAQRGRQQLSPAPPPAPPPHAQQQQQQQLLQQPHVLKADGVVLVNIPPANPPAREAAVAAAVAATSAVPPIDSAPQQ